MPPKKSGRAKTSELENLKAMLKALKKKVNLQEMIPRKQNQAEQQLSTQLARLEGRLEGVLDFVSKARVTQMDIGGGTSLHDPVPQVTHQPQAHLVDKSDEERPDTDAKNAQLALEKGLGAEKDAPEIVHAHSTGGVSALPSATVMLMDETTSQKTEAKNQSFSGGDQRSSINPLVVNNAAVQPPIRRPKPPVAKDTTEERTRIALPISDGVVAIRGKEEHMFRPTWYFATVRNGVAKILRRTKNGRVAYDTTKFDGVMVDEYIVIDKLPKKKAEWTRPSHAPAPNAKNPAKTGPGAQCTAPSKSAKLPSSQPVGVPPQLETPATSDSPVAEPSPTDNNTNNTASTASDAKNTQQAPEVKAAESAPFVVKTVAARQKEQQQQQKTKPAVNTPAQNLADDKQWEELVPMLSDVLAEEAKIGLNVDQEEVFRRRRVGGPFAAVVKGRFLTTLKLRKEHVEDLSTKCVALSTVKAHKRILRQLQGIPEKFWDLNLDRAMEQYFLEEKQKKAWLPTTLVVKMATAHGALRLLPLYAEDELPIMMKESVIWMSAMKAAGRMAKEHPPNQPAVATWEDVKVAMAREPRASVKLALLTAWLTCGRGGDVLLLKPKNVVLTMRDPPKGHTGQVAAMAVSFWKGKTVKTRGSHTVFTSQPPPEYMGAWAAYTKEMEASDYLFKGVKGADLKDALRRANAKLEQRSLRRGAIQAMAATGLTDHELLHYSGHSNVAMLRRYLNFGKVSGEGARLAMQARALIA